jgi:hypothetical protein
MSTHPAGSPRDRSNKPALMAIPVLSAAFGFAGGHVIGQPMAMAVFGLVWGLIVMAIAPRLARLGSRSPAQANAPIYLMLPLACIVLGGSLLAHIVGATPAGLLQLLQHPGYGLFFYSIHGLFEWVLMPWALIANWYHTARRRLLIVAAVLFYAARLASALYFAPNALEWGANPADAAARMAEIDLWIRLDLLRLLLQDVIIAAIMLLAALRSGWQPRAG